MGGIGDDCVKSRGRDPQANALPLPGDSLKSPKKNDRQAIQNLDSDVQIMSHGARLITEA